MRTVISMTMMMARAATSARDRAAADATRRRASRRGASPAAGAGFTLMEVLIALALLAVLLTIALPAYREQLARSRRSELQAALLEDAGYMQRYYAANNAFNATPPPLTDIQLKSIQRLLVVKTSSLGDVIHALPVVQAIKDAAPHLTLGWVVRRRCADILQGNPSIDHLYVMPDQPSLADLRTLRRTLHQGRFEMALDMQGLLLSGLVTWLSGAPVRVGWDRNREMNSLFLTHPIISGKARVRHEVDLLYGFAEALGVQAAHSEFMPQPYLAAENAGKAKEWLANLPHPRIALNVGASRGYKRWPLENWNEVALSLTQAGRSVVFVGDKTDAESVAQITPTLSGVYVDLSGKTTLRELASVLAGCDLLISGDSGPMHLAVAVGTPTIALFGATQPMRHGPYGPRNIVLHDPAPGIVAPGKRPTEAEGAACMARIAPQDVLDALPFRYT